jgi:thiosulfate dehydrogenase (quinone) large subunit
MEARRRGGRANRDWIGPGAALLPLRLFLGGTFVYAGIQKLSDPGFFHPGAPTYIGTQLHNFASSTPGGFILRAFAIPHPVLAGVGVAIAEIMIGLLALLGLRTRLAAGLGMALNFLLFLTASWHTTPYFLGPDLVFTFAWLPFVLTGASGQPALDNVLEQGSATLERRTRLRPAEAAGPRRGDEPIITRRRLVAQTGAAALALAGIASLAKGGYNGPTTKTASLGSAGNRSSGSAARGGGGNSAGGGGGGRSASVPANAVKLGPSNRLPTGQAASYSDPSDGSTDILIRESDGSLKAFSAICTHAGCQVEYSGGEIVCPCHGSVFSAQTGQVEAGPAPTGLAPKRVVESRGQIYALPS